VQYPDLSQTSSAAATPASVVMPAVENTFYSVATVLASVKVHAVATKVAPTTFYAAGTVPYQDLSQTFSAATAPAYVAMPAV